MTLRKNVASQKLPFCLVNASTGAALTGATVTARITLDGAAQATATGTVSEPGNGQYLWSPAQADTNANSVGVLFTATSAIPVHFTIYTTAADPTDVVRFGLTALPNTAVTTNASLLTSGVGTDQLSVSAGKVLLQATQTGVTIPTVTTVGSVTGSVGSVTGSVGSVTGAVGSVTGNVGGNVTGSVGSVAAGGINRATFAADTGLQSSRSNTAQAGAATTITLDAGANATNSFYNNMLIVLTGGTGVGQARFITAYVGATKVATVGTWVTNPDSTTTFAILAFDAVAGATAPTTAQIATAVWTDLLASADFSTASSIGKLLKDDIDAAISSRMATYTQPTGFLAATFPAGTVASTINITAGTMTTTTNLTNAATAGDFTATMKTSLGTATAASSVASVTGNVGGNVVGSVGSVVGNVGGNVVGSVGSLTTTAVDNILDRSAGIETSLTPRQGLRLMVAALAGKLSGAATTTVTIRDTTDTKSRVVATVDSAGNRTAITTDLT